MRSDARLSAVGAALLALGCSTVLTGCNDADAADEATPNAEAVEFSETSVIVEINATDGDVGFHTLLDADAWKEVRMADSEGNRLFAVVAKGSLVEQGLTENFFESAEPLCSPDPEEPDAEVVPLSEFLERFPEGNYQFTGTTIEDESLQGDAELTHNLPAAPRDITFDGSVITWAAGTDLGGCQDNQLVTDGVIPDPGTVQLVGWEVTVEPADEEAVDPLRVFTVQLPAQAPMTVAVPAEFINAYRADGVTEFKVEVGAIEASGNRTFSEEEFETEAP